jgi:peptidyl-prolyl cis-trans isomerase B (cyclophilin B)
MTRWTFSWWKGASRLALAASLGSLVGCGSGKPAGPDVATKATPDAPTVSVPGAASAPHVVGTEQTALPPFPGDALHLPFAKATRGGDDPPALCNRPPDSTITGKPVGKLYDEVVRSWETIRFVSTAGKALAYYATIETELGEIEIALRPDVAPNHVRNFIALARVGYFDGLRFDRVRHEEPEMSGSGAALDQVEAGCPDGSGEAGNGSIGYWLKPEFDSAEKPKLTHEEGTVGACRGTEADSAGCKFYVTLSKAPYLDGNYTAFGKVTKGLDVARRIFHQPGAAFESDPDGSRRPLNPVVIRKVTIHAHETDGAEGQH